MKVFTNTPTEDIKCGNISVKLVLQYFQMYMSSNGAKSTFSIFCFSKQMNVNLGMIDAGLCTCHRNLEIKCLDDAKRLMVHHIKNNVPTLNLTNSVNKNVR